MNKFILLLLMTIAPMACWSAPTASGIGIKVPGGKKLKIEKTAKSLFLIKKAQVDASVGEPQFYPIDAQLRTIINDLTLHNTAILK